MNDPGQFERKKTLGPKAAKKKAPASQAANALACEDFEALLSEGVESALPSDQTLRFREHSDRCERCSVLLSQAHQGHDWLLLLQEEELDAPAGLVESILSRTSGLGDRSDLAPTQTTAIPTSSLPTGALTTTRMPNAPAAQGILLVADRPQASDDSRLSARPWTPTSGRRSALLALWSAVLDPRLALTAAMAFFSISLTLNMFGIHLNGLRAADLTPKNVQRNLTRQYVQANSRVVRYYENLRFVYELESRVQELRRAAESTDSSDQTQPATQPGKQSQSSPSSPASSPADPAKRAPLPALQRDRIRQVPLGAPVDAALRLPQKASPAFFDESSYDAREKSFDGTIFTATIFSTTPMFFSRPIANDRHSYRSNDRTVSTSGYVFERSAA